MEKAEEEGKLRIVVKKDERKTNNYYHLYTRATIFSLYDVVSMHNPNNPHNKQPRPSTAISYKNYLDKKNAIIRQNTIDWFIAMNKI